MGVLPTSPAKSGAYYPSASTSCLCGSDLHLEKSSTSPFKSVQAKLQRILRHNRKSFPESPSKLSAPILFHPVHGDHISLSSCGTQATRVNSYRKAIAFSHRPVAPYEKVYLRFSWTWTTWSGVARVGFTTQDPSTLENRLPDYAIPDLTIRQGFWMKELKEKYVKKEGATLYFYYDGDGQVYFGDEGTKLEKRLMYATVDSDKPLWLCIDIYGKTSGVELVDLQKLVNESVESLALRRCSSLATINKSRSLGRRHSIDRPLPPIPVPDALEDDKGDKLCLMCAEKPSNTLIIPCAHQCLCRKCAIVYCRTRKPENLFCPFCKVKVTDVLG